MELDTQKCRLCSSDSILEQSIFESIDDNGISTSTKIMMCTSLLVLPEDVYSKQICRHCADLVDLFFDFRSTCLKTHISMSYTLSEEQSNIFLQVDNYEGDNPIEETSLEHNEELAEQNSINKEYTLEIDINKVTNEEIVLGDNVKNEICTNRRFQVGCYIPVAEDTVVCSEEKDDEAMLRRFKCINCKDVFSTLDELDGHWEVCESKKNSEKNETTDLVIPYSECSANEEDAKLDKQKLETKQFCCETCGQVFKQLLLLKRHIQAKHIRVRPYDCPQCPRKFFDKYELKYHQRLHQDIEDFCCRLCGRRFARRAGLKIHMRSHTGEKPFDCNLCGKSFGHLHSLIVHERVHTGERPYNCSYCHRTFTQHSTAKSHEQMHMGGLRMYQCEICDRMFKTEGELTSHSATHEGVYEFDCTNCEKSFKKQGDLNKHRQRYHSNNKPFPCEHCSKSYVTLRELKLHMSIHTGELPFKCLFCSRGYCLKTTLRRHMLKSHQNNTTEELVNTDSININYFKSVQ